MNYRRQTFIKERGVVVSTVGYEDMIGYNRTAETVVFPADGLGNIIRCKELYMEPHGIHPTREELDQAHERIVCLIKEGKIELMPVKGV